MRKCRLIRNAAVLCCTLASVALAQTATPQDVWVGEVTANDVYVRSGPSANYYPVTKLAAGARVRVHGNTDGWLVIESPVGCFSLIHKDFVDAPAEGTGPGVVNGTAVLVRAGSTLSADLYAKQLKLNKGATVEVLGPHNEDYLRIAPPPEARSYVSAPFVERLSASRLAAKPVAATEADAPAVVPDAGPAGVEPAAEPPADTPEIEPGAYREELARIDVALEAEEGKPFLHREYSALIARYRRLADQEDDAYTASYAAERIAQLEDAADSLAMVKGIRMLGDELATERKNSMQLRERMRPPLPVIGGGFDVVGEIRESMIYGPNTVPRRLRLVGDDRVRTIGYVEIPEDSSLNVASFLGRRVGVRARGTRLQTEGVDPLMIYTAAEVVVLDSGGNERDGGENSKPRK